MMSQGSLLTVFGRSDIGEVRRNNEDAFLIADLMESLSIQVTPQPIAIPIGKRGVLLAVSDGMGGEQAGEVASALALHALRLEMTTSGTAEAALTASVEKANTCVWCAAADPGLEGMGATLTAVLIQDDRAYVAEVGDSRAYVLRGGRFVQLTHDQSYTQLLLDAGRLTPKQAETYRYRNVILQAMGTSPSVVVALNSFALHRGDRVLLCSDGLSQKVRDNEIHSLLTTSAGLDTACSRLIDLANFRGGEDNITVIVAQIDGEGLPASTGEDRVPLETIRAFAL